MPKGIKGFQKGNIPWMKGKKGEKYPKNTGFQKGNKIWVGRKRALFTKEHRDKIRKATKKNPSNVLGKHWRIKDTSKMKGRIKEKSPSWKGGITPINTKIRNSIEFHLWREAIFARDNWTCQKYGIKGGKLHPHHIQNFADYPELRLAIDNGITLSEKAHREFHKKFGVKNNTKEQIIEFLINDQN